MAKKHAMEAGLLGDKNVNSKNETEDLKVKDKDNIDMSTADLYLYAITIACKY